MSQRLYYVYRPDFDHVVRPAAEIAVVKGNLFLNDEDGSLISMFPKGEWIEVTTINLDPEDAQ